MSDETEKLGRYELLRRIAVGGMGEIYLARSRGAGGFEKTLIIKKILPHLASDPQFVDKFLDEGRIIVNLSHGNIVPVFDMDEEDGEYYIAMEYVPGRDVRAVMQQLEEAGEAMPPELACFVISEICEGLAYAHRQTDSEGNPLNIVHRDVSPSNVLLSTEGEVKLIDFGIARAAGRRSETVSGRVQGKVCYMSPEQATGGDVDARSDIFSVGTVLYEMLTGVRPFQGDTDLESLDLVRQCDYPPPSEVNEGLPADIDTVIERSMARKPADRYASADQMQSDLIQILYSGGETVTSRELAEFLRDLFPEGVERKEFKEELSDESTGAQASDDGGLDLEDALNQQLDHQRGSTPDPRGRTATLETPSHPERVEDPAEDGGDSAADGAEALEPSDPASDGFDQSSDETEIRGILPSVSWSAAVVALIVLAGVVVGATYLFEERDKATLLVESEPAGARVIVDGAEIAGLRTPGDVRLAPGRHTVRFAKEGYRPRTFSVDIAPGEDARLTPELSPEDDTDQGEGAESRGPDGTTKTSQRDAGEPASKSIRVVTSSGEGTLWVDGERIGEIPARASIKPGAQRRIEVRRDGCEPVRRTIGFEAAPGSMSFELSCTDRRETTTKPDPRPPGDIALTIESEPAGTNVLIDGVKVGRTPIQKEFPADKELRVVLQKPGFQPLEKTLRPADVDGNWRATLEEKPTGCLDFFAVRPQYNEIAIDGEWLDGRRQSLKDYELVAGEHTIRVRNKAAGRDETFTFSVEPGDECTSLTVWDPDEGG